MPGANNAPAVAEPGSWRYFTAEEGTAIEALVDRLIPPDPQTPGGKDAGCAVFIDRQLAGPYGTAEAMVHARALRRWNTATRQSVSIDPGGAVPAGLAALDKHCHATNAGKSFAQLPDNEKDKVLSGLEKASCSWRAQE